MSQQTDRHGDPEDNTVRLRGRVSSAPVERQLPSGAVIVSFRISVVRARTPMTAGSRQGVDWVDCTAWNARARRSVSGWQVGDTVEVDGSLRRRFYPSAAGSATRLEVEAHTVRRDLRVASGVTGPTHRSGVPSGPTGRGPRPGPDP